jgi:hypothetical protein
VVVGNHIKCYGFCPGVGKEESRRSTWAHASRSFSQWADEPRAGRSAVEVPCCTGWGAVEAPPSRVPRTSRSRSAVEALRRAGLVRDGPDTRSRRATFYCGFSRFSFLLAMDVGTPILLVPTHRY